MVLVYSNSKERAMYLATRIDGVVLKNKSLVDSSNFDELRGELEAELTRAGLISTFFRGDSYIFMYTNGKPCAPSKMADYDSAFSDIRKRTVPFLPQEFGYRVIDAEFKERIDFYQQIFNDSAKVINAATDDIDGELSFARFYQIMGGRKPVYRARPIAMTTAAVVEAFNALEEVHARHGYEAACQLREQFDWLISCNATNVLTQHSFGRKLIVVGRLESVFLSYIAERELERRRMKKTPAYTVTVTLRAKDGTKFSVIPKDSPYFASKADADSFAEKIKKSAFASVVRDTNTSSAVNIPLLNVYTVQVAARAPEIGFSPERTSAALKRLFMQGYITWPCSCSALPWSAKPLYSNAITALIRSKKYGKHIRPVDMDEYLDWEKSAISFNRVGIILTDKAVGDDVTGDERIIYDIIAASNITTLRAIRETKSRYTEVTVGNCGMAAISNEGKDVHRKGYAPQPVADLSPGTELEIKNVQVEHFKVPGAYTDADLISDILVLVSDGFCESADIFSAALSNLVLWGQITRDENGVLEITPAGLEAYKYIKGTSLTDIFESLNWDRRLQAVAESRSDPQKYLDDMYAYTSDLCEELTRVANEICEMGGMSANELLCPVCSNEICPREEGGWSCKSDACKFSIPKTFYGHEITSRDVALLLTKGTTGLLLDFSSSKGSNYAARLILEDGKVKRSFASPYSCPKCGSAVSEYAWGIKCKTESCGFSMNATVCKHRLTEDEMSVILSGQMTKGVQMENSSGKAFVAKLSLDENGNIKFTFPDKKKPG